MPRKPQQKTTPARPKKREVPRDLLVDLYKKMLHVYYLEERVKTFVRAGKVSFHASSRGHEKVQIALSYLLEPGKDWFFPYYREKALMVGLGMPLKDIFLHMLSKADDPCGGPRRLVAVEYAIPLALSARAPAGFAGSADQWSANQAFQLWTLHAWVYEFNPDGVFAPHNPRVQ